MRISQQSSGSPTVPNLKRSGRFTVSDGVVSVSPYPSRMRTPMAWKNSRISRARGAAPRRDAEVLDQARERVGERQEEEVDVALVNQPGPERRLDGCEVVAVRLHDALWGSGRARRVHDGRHVVPGERRHASLDLGP